ncbi:MAG: response regulator [Pseudobdellovibrionaceae bacterium]
MGSQKPVIAIVEDEASLLELYQEILSDSYEVVPFLNPTDFIEAVVTKRQPVPHLLISDLVMPKMTGIQMIAEVHKHGFRFPSIIVSGNLDVNTAIEALEIGVFRLMEKPFKPNELTQAIELLLAEHDLYVIRHEIRQSVTQLKEMYSILRDAFEMHLPKEVLDRMFIVPDESGGTHSEGFHSVILSLEKKVERLSAAEETLEEIRWKPLKRN